MLIKEKWDPISLASPLRTYLYQVVDEQNAPFYQPGPGEDEHKWEEAFSKRPGPGCVPALARGFWDLGKRAQRQREFIEKINVRLHDIDQSLDAQLEIHSQKVAARLAECRRKHMIASQRTLALAAKIQTLRNRGYVMDNAEEELKIKLSVLEREVFDPSLNGREQEIWARMLGIREQGHRLRKEIERTAPAANDADTALDEGTVQAAKRVNVPDPRLIPTLTQYYRRLKHMMCSFDIFKKRCNWFKRSTRTGRKGWSPIRTGLASQNDLGAFAGLKPRIC